MSKFENTKTGVVVSVDDSKDERFSSGWKLLGAAPASKRKAASPAAKPTDDE